MGPLGPITVATLSVTAVWAGQLEERFGIKVVGPIQAGMPPITVRSLLIWAHGKTIVKVVQTSDSLPCCSKGVSAVNIPSVALISGKLACKQLVAIVYGVMRSQFDGAVLLSCGCHRIAPFSPSWRPVTVISYIPGTIN